MQAGTRISGFRPYHLPSPVNVWLAPAIRSLYDSVVSRAIGNRVSMKAFCVSDFQRQLRVAKQFTAGFG